MLAYHDLIDKFAQTPHEYDRERQRAMLDKVHLEQIQSLNMVRSGTTPLMLAVQHQLPHAIEWLCEKARSTNVALDANHSAGFSALMVAVAYADPETKGDEKSAPPAKRQCLNQLLTLLESRPGSNFLELPPDLLHKIFKTALQHNNLYFVNRMMEKYLDNANPTPKTEGMDRGWNLHGQLARIILGDCMATASVAGLKLYLAKRSLWVERNVFPNGSRYPSEYFYYSRANEDIEVAERLSSQYFDCIMLLSHKAFDDFWGAIHTKYVLMSQEKGYQNISVDNAKAIIQQLQSRGVQIQLSHITYAIEHLDITWLKFLRGLAPNLNLDHLEREDSENTPRCLITACRLGKADMVDFLLKDCNAGLDAQVDYRKKEGRSWHYSYEISGYGKEWGAHPKNWYTSVDNSQCYKGYWGYYAIPKDQGSFPLRNAAEGGTEGHLMIVKQILQRCALKGTDRIKQICAFELSISPLELAISARKKIKDPDHKSTSSATELDPRAAILDRVIKYLTAVKLVLKYGDAVANYTSSDVPETGTQPAPGILSKLKNTFSRGSPLEKVIPALAAIDPQDRRDFLVLFPVYQQNLKQWITLPQQAQVPKQEFKAGKQPEGEFSAGDAPLVLAAIEGSSVRPSAPAQGAGGSHGQVALSAGSASSDRGPLNAMQDGSSSVVAVIAAETSDEFKSAGSSHALAGSLLADPLPYEAPKRVQTPADAASAASSSSTSSESRASALGDVDQAPALNKQLIVGKEDEYQPGRQDSKSEPASAPAGSSGGDAPLVSEDVSSVSPSAPPNIVENSIYRSGAATFALFLPPPLASSPSRLVDSPSAHTPTELKAPVAATATSQSWQQLYLQLIPIQGEIATITQTITATCALAPTTDLSASLKRLEQLSQRHTELTKQLAEAYTSPTPTISISHGTLG